MFYIFIINPKSGLNTIQKNVYKVMARLKEEHHRVLCFETTYEGDALSYAANLPKCDLVIAVGGDGTVNEVVNGLMQSEGLQRAPLALVPAGTVNDFANYFKLPTKEQALYHYLTQFEVKGVDIGLANDRYFTNVVAAGFISDVGYRVQRRHKRRFGRLAYYVEGVREALRYMSRTNRFTFTIGDHEVSLDAYMFLALNTTHLGGLSYFAPSASCEDGFIDLFIIKKTGLLGGLVLMTEILFGRHVSDKNVIYFKVKAFEVDSKVKLSVDIDGERGTTLPYRVQVIRHGLNLAVPKQGGT